LAAVNGPALPLRRIVAGAGLLAAEDRGGRDLAGIDWQHTVAAPKGSCYVRPNLKGREPHGIVAPDAVEEVGDRVVRALLDFRDPATGVCPFSLVMPRARDLRAAARGVRPVDTALRRLTRETRAGALPGVVGITRNG
jgi:predicted AlkP superfamily phosphohydrolase/phosphomutase